MGNATAAVAWMRTDIGQQDLDTVLHLPQEVEQYVTSSVAFRGAEGCKRR